MTRIWLAGHGGMVGGALLRQLQARVAAGADLVLLTSPRHDPDLTCQAGVRAFLQSCRPDVVLLAAARVGGIQANLNQPADFIYENMMIAANVIHQSRLAGVQSLLQLGSSCIYPREGPQPIPEEALLQSAPEPSNEPYAMAKIAALKLCESCNRQYGTDYRSLMPCNLYGPGDNFHPETSHVLPALIARFHAAVQNGQPEVVIWGSGQPRREFLHVDDLAAAALHVLDLPPAVWQRHTAPQRGFLNVGAGQDLTIRDLAGEIARATGFTGRIRLDPTRPDGTPRKLIDSRRLRATGWQPQIPLARGIAETCAWYLAHQDRLRA